MKRLVLCCVFAAFFAKNSQAQSAAEREILQVEREGCLAYQNNDAEKIAAFLAPDYTLTDSKGQITRAADDINDAKSGKVRYEVFENYDMQARTYGDCTAIVVGKTRVKGTAEGAPIDIVVQFTDTFVKLGGHWRLAAGHVSRLKD
jgi:ketosteroid isomerase-like protein